MRRFLPVSLTRRLPWGLVGMLALIGSTELLLTRARSSLTNKVAACWNRAGKDAERARDAKILCLGTSIVKIGVLPRVLEERTGKRAKNLAVFGGPIPASYFLLRRALAAGSRPEAVIIDCQDMAIPGRSREFLAEELRFHTRLWSELLDLTECFDLSWSAGNTDFFVRSVLARALPSFKEREDIRDAIGGALQARDDRIRDQMKICERNWAANQGAHVLERNPASEDMKWPPTDLPAHLIAEAVPPDPRMFESVQGAYARRLLALAESRGITVFWLLPPFPAQIQAHHDDNGETFLSVQLARTLQSRFRGMVVIDGRRSTYNAGVFADTVHLDRDGAALLSTDLGTIVARHLANPASSPSWVPLPRDPGVVPDVPMIEDFCESALVLQKRGVIR